MVALRDDPVGTRARLADAWTALWESVVAPHWEQLQRLLRADIALRVRRIADCGLAAMVDTLHERISWQTDAIAVARRFHSEVSHPTLFYPAAGVTETWTGQRETVLAALARLMGEGRARTLLCLDVAHSTSEVAAECDALTAVAG